MKSILWTRSVKPVQNCGSKLELLNTFQFHWFINNLFANELDKALNLHSNILGFTAFKTS